MTSPQLGAPLRAFVDALGGHHESWRSHEQPNDITYADLRLSRESAIRLPFHVLHAMTESYGDALSCTFHDGDDLLLRVDHGLEASALEHLADESRGLDEITLQFRLNKRRLVDRYFQVPSSCRAVLYCYPDAFDALLQCSLEVIEDRLWGGDASHKLIVVLDEHSIFLDGEMLAVVGGEHVDRVAQIESPDPTLIEQLKTIHGTAIEHLHWRREWTHFLTPRHLAVQGIDDASIGARLRSQSARLFVLYTADKSVDAIEGIACTYSSPDVSVDVVIPSALDATSIHGEMAAGMRQVFNWVYEDPSATKRLSVAQLVFARHLHFVDPGMRFEHLLRVLERARDELVWTEKAVMSETLRTYAADVRSLEDYVDKTVQAFAEQVSAVVKSVTDITLAGLGAVIVGVLALLIKEGAGSVALGVALLVYAIYVLLFQIKYILPSHEDREKILADDFEVRRNGFKERIYDESVDRIVGDRLVKARAIFQKWMKCARVLSWVIVVLFFVTGLVLLVLGARAQSGMGPKITPSVTITSTARTVVGIPSRGTGVPSRTSLPS